MRILHFLSTALVCLYDLTMLVLVWESNEKADTYMKNLGMSGALYPMYWMIMGAVFALLASFHLITILECSRTLSQNLVVRDIFYSLSFLAHFVVCATWSYGTTQYVTSWQGCTVGARAPMAIIVLNLVLGYVIIYPTVFLTFPTILFIITVLKIRSTIQFYTWFCATYCASTLLACILISQARDNFVALVKLRNQSAIQAEVSAIATKILVARNEELCLQNELLIQRMKLVEIETSLALAMFNTPIRLNQIFA